jgi:hypothetical protein
MVDGKYIIFLSFMGFTFLFLSSCRESPTIQSALFDGVDIVPTLTAVEIIDPSFTSVQVSGRVINEGSSSVTSRGFCYSSTPNSIINAN